MGFASSELRCTYRELHVYRARTRQHGPRSPQLSATQPRVQPPPGSVSQLASEGGIQEVLSRGASWPRECPAPRQGGLAAERVTLGAGMPGVERPHRGSQLCLAHKCWGLPAGLGPNSAGLKCSELCCRSQGQCCHCCVWDMLVCGLVDLPGSVRVLSDASSIKSLCVQAQMSVYLPPGCNSNSLAFLSRFSTWGLIPRRMQFLRLVVVTAGLQ